MSVEREAVVREKGGEKEQEGVAERSCAGTEAETTCSVKVVGTLDLWHWPDRIQITSRDSWQLRAACSWHLTCFFFARKVFKTTKVVWHLEV